MVHPHGRYFLLGLIGVTSLVAYLIAAPFLAPLALAAVFAVILYPVYSFLLKKMEKFPGITAALTVLFGFLVILVPLALIITQIVAQATSVYVSLTGGAGREILQRVLEAASSVTGGYIPSAGDVSQAISQNISSYAESALQWIIQHAGSAVASIAATLVSTVVFLISLYYFIRDGYSFREAIIRFSPLRDAHDEQVFERLRTAVNSVVRGSLLIALIQGVLSTVGFFIFGVPNAILWGSLAALGALVPGLGTGLVFIPIIIIQLATGNTFAAVGLSVWGITAVGLVDNFLSPRLIGSGIKLHPLLVLVSVLGGISYFGPIGVFLGPLTLSLLFALLTIYMEWSHPQSA